MLWGAAFGIIVGAVQLWLLVKFADAVTKAEINAGAVIAGLTQLLVPLAGLVLCAFFMRGSLTTMGIALAATLLVGAAVVLTIRSRKKDLSKRGDEIR